MLTVLLSLLRGSKTNRTTRVAQDAPAIALLLLLCAAILAAWGTLPPGRDGSLGRLEAGATGYQLRFLDRGST